MDVEVNTWDQKVYLAFDVLHTSLKQINIGFDFPSIKQQQLPNLE